MLKYILLATTITIATPALAQETKTSDSPTTSAAQQTTTADPSAQPAQTAPAPNQAVPPAPAEGQAAQPAATAQQPANATDQVASIVSTEFKGYDKDANGTLDKTEFSTWMAALRTASEPTFKPGTPEATTWITKAFAQADTDKSKSVSQAELTRFLTPKSG